MASPRWLNAVLIGLFVATAVAIGYALPYPERWDENLIGLKREDAWTLLGVPNVNLDSKGFDGWNRNAIFGSWVLIVRYGNPARITSVERKFHWGLGYLIWDDDYKEQWHRKIGDR